MDFKKIIAFQVKSATDSFQIILSFFPFPKLLNSTKLFIFSTKCILNCIHLDEKDTCFFFAIALAGMNVFLGGCGNLW